jgi:ABC-2 type transport system ATP-binding protein
MYIKKKVSNSTELTGMISLINLLKKFDTTVAVDIENMVISPGEILGIVGNNGAGKTTLLKLMLDLLKPERGQVLSKEIQVYQSEHWKKYTGSFIDNNFLIEFLRPEEYFEFIGFLYKAQPEELKVRLEQFKLFMNGEIIGVNKYIRSLSSGNKQKVGIIGALLSEPEVLILDEPFNFLDPSSQIILRHILMNHSKANSSTIILSSHNLKNISELSSRIVLMEKGRIIGDFLNDAASIKKIEAYFSAQVEYSGSRSNA